MNDAAHDPLTDAEHVAKIKSEASQLAVSLKDATEAGVSHALILPQLVLVFREAFGPLPAGVEIPGLSALGLA